MRCDYRSDTVTQPSQMMREAMLSAPVGDDVFKEDPTINELEEYTAKLFGKEAALYCTSGTQTNQIAINVHCKPGDEVICSEEAHIYWYEGGGVARNSGTSVALIRGNRGRISANDVLHRINDPEDIHHPLTALVAIEDTVNRGGGALYDFETIKAIRKVCSDFHLPFHLDGARMMNALVETKIDYKEYASQFNSISLCLSKGLGAPVGSLLIGDRDFITKARRVRKVFGGGMRQAGMIAAGGLYALKHNIERLKEDHRRAKILEKELNEFSWIKQVLPVETNIVVAELKNSVNVNEMVEKAKSKEILFLPFGGQNIRLVTHLDIDDQQIEYTISTLKNL